MTHEEYWDFASILRSYHMRMFLVDLTAAKHYEYYVYHRYHVKTLKISLDSQQPQTFTVPRKKHTDHR